MRIWKAAGALALAFGAAPVAAQQPDVTELIRRIEALQQRVNQLERERRAPRPAARAAVPAQPAAPAAPAPSVAAVVVVPPPRTPEVVRAEVDQALRGSLDGLAMRVPNTDTSVRLYGFIRLTGYTDFNARNPTDAASVQGIPLTGSAAASQTGGFDMTARGSRIGFDTRTETGWGRLDTTVEADFRGEISQGGDLALRLRLAFAELTRGDWSFLAGQANSLWNEGLIEAYHDATNLNQSFIRQAQLRATRRFGPNWTVQASLEAPYGDVTTQNGPIFSPIRLDGGASPVFDQAPDLLARLTWRDGPEEYVLRGLVRRLALDADGTVLGPGGSESSLGWGIAAHARLPLGRWMAPFGRDELLLMGHYGEGVGRYFAGNTFGQAALSDITSTGGTGFSLEPVPSYGGTIGYRRFWSDTLRSTVAYAYARQDFPDGIDFAPGSRGALSLNREMQQVIANLVWSPFAANTTTRQPFGWLDLGIEYVFSRRDLEDGAQAAGSGGVGHGIANRLVAFGVARF
ncbi:DcaP family trimeric outer membrane transporter [Falsiroseomonas sp.]|uniref:DcaP family trimeric outer membrane transporter n=1 Tax=Falsiroseomonas sp. TaxID=2870721 RepID=UPI00271F0540|nr:DcaP family trimeric outer membrane transporter [Falsiroseomonas sp.]MDO9503041.1 DcaP family trimeric outer membrane transporter [Falsiroseomonas sp.]